MACECKNQCVVSGAELCWFEFLISPSACKRMWPSIKLHLVNPLPTDSIHTWPGNRVFTMNAFMWGSNVEETISIPCMSTPGSNHCIKVQGLCLQYYVQFKTDCADGSYKCISSEQESLTWDVHSLTYSLLIQLLHNVSWGHEQLLSSY